MNKYGKKENEERGRMIVREEYTKKRQINSLRYSRPTHSLDLEGQLFKQSSARVLQKRVLSYFQFAQRFYLNTISVKSFRKAEGVDWKSTYFILKITH